MKNRTVRVIIILVALLFLNIEAAHAGLIHKFKLFIQHEFPNLQLLYITGGLLTFGVLMYIIFTPVPIGKEKWSWFNYYTYNPNRHNYHSKREVVKKISGILKNAA
jgi:hypothetical protein